jgi:hypothetical protein
MKEVDFPAPVLANDYSWLKPANRLKVGWNPSAANILPSGPRHIAAQFCIYRAYRPIDLHSLSVSVSNYIHKLGPFKTLATIERVKGFGSKAFEGRLVILAKRIEEIMDGSVDLGPGINRSVAVGLTRMGAPSQH